MTAAGSIGSGSHAPAARHFYALKTAHCDQARPIRTIRYQVLVTKKGRKPKMKWRQDTLWICEHE